MYGVDLHSVASKEEPSCLALWKVCLGFLQYDSLYLTTLLSDYLKGTLRLDEYVTHERTFEDINKGFDDMHVSF